MQNNYSCVLCPMPKLGDSCVWVYPKGADAKLCSYFFAAVAAPHKDPGFAKDG